MRNTINLGRNVASAAGAGFRKYLEDTVDGVRLAYLSIYGITLVLSLLVGYLSSRLPYSWMPSVSGLAAGVAMLGMIVCAVYGYIFGARLVFGAVGFNVLRRFLRRYFQIDEKNLSILNVWYYQAFIAMWVTAPLAALAIFRPWETGRSFQLLFATFMVLHIVATQKEIGKFWRRVYMGCAALVAATVIFAAVNPGDWARISGSHQRGQRLSFYEEGYQATLAGKLLPQKQEIDQQIAQVEYAINQAIVAGTNTQDLDDRKTKLVQVRSRIQDQIETQGVWASSQLPSVPHLTAGLDSFELLLIFVGLALVVAILLPAFIPNKASTTTTAHS